VSASHPGNSKAVPGMQDDGSLQGEGRHACNVRGESRELAQAQCEPENTTSTRECETVRQRGVGQRVVNEGLRMSQGVTNNVSQYSTIQNCGSPYSPVQCSVTHLRNMPPCGWEGQSSPGIASILSKLSCRESSRDALSPRKKSAFRPRRMRGGQPAPGIAARRQI